MIGTLGRTAIGLAAARMPSVQEIISRALTVFLYHEVSERPSPFSHECGLAVTLRQFTEQIRFITETFNVISMDELLIGQVPPRAALITFDDGSASIFRQALPILHQRSLPSTVFVNMATVLGEPCWAARVVYLCHHVDGFLQFLGERVGRQALDEPYVACTPTVVQEWEQAHGEAYLGRVAVFTGSFATLDDLRGVSNDPLVTFGNHAYHHYSLAGLSEEAFRTEVEANAQALSVYRNTRPVFGFPFGRPGRSFLQSQVEYLQAWGYRRCFTGPPRLNLDPAAPLLYRIAFTSWHDRRLRMWFQLARAALAARRRRLEPMDERQPAGVGHGNSYDQ